MMKKIVCALTLLSVSISLSAQIFTQDFESSSSVSSYTSLTPGFDEFSAISNSSEVATSITNGRLRFDKTATGSAYFFRSPNPELTPEPTFIQMKFDFEVTNNDPNHPDDRRSIPFYFGPSFNAQGSSINSAFCAFGLNISATQGNFFLTVEPNGTVSSEFTGKQAITFVANNTGSTQTYPAPDGTTESIASEKWEIWVGNTKVFDEVSARKPDLSFGSFKMQYNSFLPKATLDFDNFEFKDFLYDFSPKPPTQSLVHPHIWVSPSDRASILENISNYTWASSMFTQLKDRHNARANNHANNPSLEINMIPAIPGDRGSHRERLNIGVECAMLFYLTEEERYAQVAADILHQYVKQLSVQDVDFHFYTTSFNHLIPPRELFPRVAMIYDFVQPFLVKSGVTVFDSASNTQVAFNFETSQKAFEVMADNVIEIGGNGSNHPVLELPGALYSVLCMEDDTTREGYFNLLMNGAANSKQPGVNWMLDRFSLEERLWPESTGYGKFTHALFIQIMNIVDNYKPELNLIDNNKDILESIFIYENFLYPNGATMAYGDINRDFADHGHIFRAVMEIANRKGYSELKERAASTLKKIYTEEGGYNPVIENERLEWNSPLQLLWGVNIDASISDAGEPQYGTVKATHAGVVMQRNYVEVNNEEYGLMYYTGGGTYVHTHATGLDLEIYGAGYVIGPDHGSGTYGTDIHEQYAVSYAAHNTIIVNGTSGRGPKTNGNVTWQNIVDPIVLEASEPAIYAEGIADNFSFSTQFLDDNQNDLDQQRTNGIIRTSATTGYYVDIFRSNSNTVNNFHDYLFHGLGDDMQLSKGQSPLNLVNTPSRYQNDAGDDRKQPGWRWFTDAKTSESTNQSITARFDLQYDNKYLHVNVPGGVDREYTSALAPPTKAVKNGYHNKDTQMFIMRKYGEAWDQPFVAIYEPSGNANSTVKSTNQIYSNNKVVGVEVVSEVNGSEIIDVILSNADNNTSLNLSAFDIVFSGRFAIVRLEVENDKTNVSLYLGEGDELTFNGETIDGDSDGKGYLEYTLNYEYKFSPKSDNFTIETIGETCENKENGQVIISADANYNYVASINNNTYAFSNSTTIEGLAPGTYNMCIDIEGESFEQCYELVIERGLSLSGKIQVDKKSAKVTVASGSAPYSVFKNGTHLFETYQSNFSIPIEHGDELEVKSKSDCQGVLAKTINLFDEIKAYPNPSKGVFELYIPNELKEVDLEIYNMHSQLINSGTYRVNSGSVLLDIEDKPDGIYFVKVKSEKPIFVKLIKK